MHKPPQVMAKRKGGKGSAEMGKGRKEKIGKGMGKRKGQVAQLSLTNPSDALHHYKRQNFKRVT